MRITVLREQARPSHWRPSLAKRTKRSVLYYVIPLLAGLAVGHAFIPPTPGPVLVASMLGVDLGWVILIGIFCGIFAMIAAGPIWGSICGKKYMVEVPEHVAQQADIDESKLPKFGTIVGIIMIPLLLIIANSVAKVVPALAGIQPVLAFLGEPSWRCCWLPSLLRVQQRNGGSESETGHYRHIEPPALLHGNGAGDKFTVVNAWSRKVQSEHTTYSSTTCLFGETAKPISASVRRFAQHRQLTLTS